MNACRRRDRNPSRASEAGANFGDLRQAASGPAIATIAHMAEDIYGVHLDGNPETESTRRHMERVLRGEPRRRWPWLLGLLAGGTAFTLWRTRRARQPGTRTGQPAVRATR